MTLALLFPGQGSQFVGMGKALAEASEPARRVFEEADDALGFSLSRLCFEGPEEELRLTANTQPAILTHSIAALRELETASPQRVAGTAFAAGHSLGEYSAHVAAGTLLFADALRLVRERGRFMQEAVAPGVGSMAAIVGLPPEEIEAACRESAQGEVVAPANFNSPEQTVIAGHAAAVARACEACTARGAKKAIPLVVSAPFHCGLMAPARARMEPLLRSVSMAQLRFPVVTNVDARPATAVSEIRDALERQIDGPVRWVDSVRRLAADGVDRVLEIGPGKVLTGLVKRIDRAIALESYAGPS
ncbi:MAG: ACP S-malonyltransferase [Acidobacteria bacterium]|nr:ACP S-malonyltransferase [Acidobacteriota bacterium]MCA1610115.1 ACP S-malonyltransferase [Acidobacteriota bacterium]